MKYLFILTAALSAGPVLAFPHPLGETKSKQRLINRAGYGSRNDYDNSNNRNNRYYHDDGNESPYYDSEDDYGDGLITDSRGNGRGSPRLSAQEIRNMVQGDDPSWEVMDPVPQQGVPPEGEGAVRYDEHGRRIVVYLPQSNAEVARDRLEYQQGFGNQYNRAPPQSFHPARGYPTTVRGFVREVAQELLGTALDQSRYGSAPPADYRVMESDMTPLQAETDNLYGSLGAQESGTIYPDHEEQQSGIIYPDYGGQQSGTIYDYNPPPGAPPLPVQHNNWHQEPAPVPAYEVYQRHAPYEEDVTPAEQPYPGSQADPQYQVEQSQFENMRARFPGDNSWDRYRSRKRRNVVASISKQEDGSASSKTNVTAAQIAQFQEYLAAYQTLQTNISNALFPLFDIVLNGTDNQIIYEMLWSIYSDLTRLGPKIIGPFSYGQHSFDWLEDRYFGNKTNVTAMAINNKTDQTTVSFLAMNSQLIKVYDFAWSAAINVTNQTGMLADMNTLGRYLVSAQNLSIAPAEWTAPQKDFDASYFTNRNRTAGNSTA